MSELKIISMEEIETKPVEWLWYPYIPYGKITIVQGDPGEGKTTLVLRIVAMLTKGEKLPCDDAQRSPINVIYQTAEDGLGDTIKPRLMAADANCARVKVIDEESSSLSMTDERLEQAIIMTGARLVVLDPVQAYLGAEVNMNSANETRSVMARLGALAEKYSCAIVLIGHMNKSNNKSSYRGLGSIDFQAVARSVLIVGRLKNEPQMRIMAQGKSSLAPEGASIAFELNKETGFKFVGEYDISVDELLTGKPKISKTEIAEDLIINMLSQGKQLQSEILEKAKFLGISKRVLDEVKKELNVKSVKEGNVWYWELDSVLTVDETKVATLQESEDLQPCNVELPSPFLMKQVGHRLEQKAISS